MDINEDDLQRDITKLNDFEVFQIFIKCKRGPETKKCEAL